jgi:thiazole synthase
MRIAPSSPLPVAPFGSAIIVPKKVAGGALLQTRGLPSTLNRHLKVCDPWGALLFRSFMELQETIAIHVNDGLARVPVGVSVAEMLGELGIDPRKVAVERNLAIVPRSTFGEVRVAEGDQYEVVHFVGGG